jgi:hypothetical protein
MNTLSDPGNLSANGASALRKRMSDQVTNKNAVPEESQVRVLEMALASPASPSVIVSCAEIVSIRKATRC